MDWNSLNPPYFHILVGNRAEFGQYAYWLNYKAHHDHNCQYVVRTLRGSKMKNVDHLYDEFSAALQFPEYFGENWAAFDECIADLDWLPARGYILMVYEAAFLLNDEVSDRPAFLRIMAKTCKEWATAPHAYFPVKLEPTPFHVLFHAREAEVSPILEFLNPVSPHTPVVLLKDIPEAMLAANR